MIKKMTLLAMVAGALAAFAVPSMASAAKLTESGALVGATKTITGTSTNTITKTTLGEIKCEKVMVSGVVNTNNGTEVEVGMDTTEGADTATNCEIVGLGPVSIDPTLNNIKGSGAGPGTASFNFNVTGICEAKSTTSKVTWNGTSTIHIEAGVEGCGTGTLTGDFKLETPSGAEVIAAT